MNRRKIVEQQAQVRKTKAPELIFQDPAFVAADRRLLNGLGGHTLVFAKHIPVVLQFTGLFQTCPAVCVSTVSVSFSKYKDQEED
jgi:hypothetical protein